MSESKVVCSACGSDDVQIAMWVNPNTREVFDDFGTFGEDDSSFCCACERHGTLVEQAGAEQAEAAVSP